MTVTEQNGVLVVEDDTARHREQRALQRTQEQQGPQAMIMRAIEKGIDAEALTRLMEQVERWQEREARNAFVAAMAAFKADPPVVRKTKKARVPTKGGGKIEYNYAPLDEAASIIGKAMARHGLSFRWEIEQGEQGLIIVHCIVEHEAGHGTKTTLFGRPDGSGQKNDAQQVGSTLTYLERYTLTAASGIATTEGLDDDGRGAPEAPPREPEFIPEEKAIEFRDRLAAIGFEEEPFLRLVGRTLRADPPETMFQIPPAALKACENWIREREQAAEGEA